MKIVVITGGNDGLGKEIAKQLSSDYNVYIIARREDVLKEVASELKVKYKKCDVTDYKSLEKVFVEIASECESIDVLINNAGLWIEGKLETNNPEQIKEIIEVNALGVIYATKAVLPYIKRPSGLIIQVNSQSGLYGKNERSIYHASKWAVTGFTKSIQEELIPEGIRVTGLYPGKIKTGLFEKNGIDKSMIDAIDAPEVAKIVKFLIDLDDSTFIPEIGVKKS